MISMRKSRLSVYKQDRLVEHFVSGSTARTAAALVGVNKSTAAYFYHRLREIIVLEIERENHEFFDGEIEVDSSDKPVVVDYLEEIMWLDSDTSHETITLGLSVGWIS